MTTIQMQLAWRRDGHTGGWQTVQEESGEPLFRIRKVHPARWELSAPGSCRGVVLQRLSWAKDEAQRLAPQITRLSGKVKINYDQNHALMPYRTAWVQEDNGGVTVLVAWTAADGPRIGRHVVAWHGARHEQRVPRGRLEQL